jgi:stalled ribosome alternative rescue factor ArfA
MEAAMNELENGLSKLKAGLSKLKPGLPKLKPGLSKLKAGLPKLKLSHGVMRAILNGYAIGLLVATLFTTYHLHDQLDDQVHNAASAKYAGTIGDEFVGHPLNHRVLDSSESLSEFVGHPLLNHAVDPSESLSSCLVVMDDNHRLPEWLAYNYFAMNMRHLVILSDPASRESPTNVLDPWRELITIEEWTEEDYFDRGLRHRTRRMEKDNNVSAFDLHMHFRERQSKFMKGCSVHLRKHNRTWVSFHDIDEFYVINSDIVKTSKQRMEEPGSIIKLINELQKNGTGVSDLALPEQYTGPCVTTYRVPYSAVESSEEERGQDVPSFLDPRQLETLRWRNHGHKTVIGKSLIDVSKLPALKHMGWTDRTRNPFSPHQLIPFCPHVNYHENAFIVINHYLGSWESYTYRSNDIRKGEFKNRIAWERYAKRKGGKRGDDIRPWITGFVRLVGEQKARLLLANTGLPANYSVSEKVDTWQRSKLKQKEDAFMEKPKLKQQAENEWQKSNLKHPNLKRAAKRKQRQLKVV